MTSAACVRSLPGPDPSRYRARYYDPSVGKFTSEDPVGFASAIDFYTYVLNNPVLLIDPSGLQQLGHPVKRGQNTIVCDGHGHIRIKIGSPPPPEAACARECMVAHEEVHRRFALSVNPDVCKGVVDGITVTPSNLYPRQLPTGEIAGANAEIACLKNLKTKMEKGDCPTCNIKALEKRIQQMEGYRAGFESMLKTLP